MADYWVSFRLHDDKRTYNQRYQNLNDAIREFAEGVWDTNTSFVALRSALDIDVLGRYLASQIDTNTDHLAIRQIGYQSTRYAGDPGVNFLALFPTAKKL